MHEIGALTKAIDLTESVAKENRIDHIKSVTLGIGELTGFLPVFFEKYFPIVIEDRPILAHAKLHLQIVKGQAPRGDWPMDAHLRKALSESKNMPLRRARRFIQRFPRYFFGEIRLNACPLRCS